MALSKRCRDDEMQELSKRMRTLETQVGTLVEQERMVGEIKEHITKAICGVEDLVYFPKIHEIWGIDWGKMREIWSMDIYSIYRVEAYSRRNTTS